MKILYIDTSSNYLYTGISADNKLIIETKVNYGHDLSKYTLPEIEKMFNNVSLTPNDIDKIIVVSGPGSFTGIRIGMTFAKIFAWSLKKKITTITSLEAMSASINETKLIVPIIDARRGYVYAGIYQNGKKILTEQYIKQTDLINYLNELNQEYLFVVNKGEFNFLNQIEYEPNILKIIEAYQDKENINPHLVEPTYLKLTEAEENRNE